jgi:hypothetical protein
MVKEIYHDILTNSYDVRAPGYETVFYLGNAVCLLVCTCTLLAPERSFYTSKSLS